MASLDKDSCSRDYDFYWWLDDNFWLFRFGGGERLGFWFYFLVISNSLLELLPEVETAAREEPDQELKYPVSDHSEDVEQDQADDGSHTVLGIFVKFFIDHVLVQELVVEAYQD